MNKQATQNFARALGVMLAVLTIIIFLLEHI